MAFFAAESDTRFVASELTRGPWSELHQHGGPPCALLARAMERRLGPDGDFLPTRLVFELLRPVLIGPVEVAVEVVRTTRTVRALDGVLSVGGVEVIRARAQFLARNPLALPPLAADPAPPALPADEGPPFPFFRWQVGYHTAMDLRFVHGGFGQAQSAAWMRMRHALVDGEAPTPLQRVVVAADSGHGITNVLPLERYTFVNPDVSVFLHRLPEGEWVLLDACTRPEPSGVGLCHSRLWDARGPIGHGLQTQVLAARPG